MENQKKAKRVRKQPAKIWLPQEENMLIEYLKDNRNFEKPTAQIYYKKFLETSGIESQWALVRSKVRNMKIKYTKAKEYENSTGAGALNDGETMKDVLFRMCSYFDDFDDIFNNKDTENVAIIESIEFEEDLNETLDLGNSENIVTITPETFSSSRKGIYSRTALSDIIDKQDDLIAFKKKKLEVDEKFKQSEIDFQREKFEYEKLKNQEEMQLKQKEIESNERIKMYEIKMKTEVALKELEIQGRAKN